MADAATWQSLSGRRATVPAHVVFRAFARETVLLNVKTGQYHGLDRVGARFFEVLRDASSLQSAGETLAAEYEQPLERITADLASFCNDLQERGLIELVDGGS